MLIFTSCCSTKVICMSDIYLSTFKYKIHRRAICSLFICLFVCWCIIVTPRILWHRFFSVTHNWRCFLLDNSTRYAWEDKTEPTIRTFICKRWNSLRWNIRDTDKKTFPVSWLLIFLDPWVDGPGKWSPADLSRG